MADTIRIGGLDIRFLHSGDETGGAVDAFEMTAQPNARMPVPHYHESWDECVFGLAGSLTFRIDGQDSEIAPGDSAFIRRGTVHGFRNDTQAPARCLCLLTPGALGPAYFQEITTLLSAPVPDLARMKETMLRYGLVPVAA